MPKEVKIGSHVVFVDRVQVPRDAIVTAVWQGDPKREPSLNVVLVHDDASMTDVYGRQIMRETSIPHRGEQNAPGYYWMRVDE